MLRPLLSWLEVTIFVYPVPNCAFFNLNYSRVEIAADDGNSLIHCRPEERSDEGS
jgi:hypothetical protein